MKRIIILLATMALSAMPSFAAVTAGTSTANKQVVQDSVTIGFAGITDGNIVFINSTNSNTFTLDVGAVTTSYTLTPPLSAPVTGNQVWRVDASGDGSWITYLNSIPSSTQASSLLRADGAGGWAEVTQITLDGNGNLALTDISVTTNLAATAAQVTGDTTVGGTLGVTGVTTMAEADITANLAAQAVQITGDATVGGTLGITGVATMSEADVTANLAAQAAQITGDATVGGTLGITGVTTMAEADSTVHLAGQNITVSNDLIASNADVTTNLTAAAAQVTGAATVGGTFGVTGVTTLDELDVTDNMAAQAAQVTADATIGGTLGVTGVTTMAEADATVHIAVLNLDVTNDAIAANADVTTNLTAAAAQITGAATVGGTLGVTGVTTLDDVDVTDHMAILDVDVSNDLVVPNLDVTTNLTAAAAQVTGAATVGGTLGVTGVTTMDEADVTDHLAALYATVSNDLIVPNADVTASLTAQAATVTGDLNCNDTNILDVGAVSLDWINPDDGTSFSIGGAWNTGWDGTGYDIAWYAATAGRGAFWDQLNNKLTLDGILEVGDQTNKVLIDGSGALSYEGTAKPTAIMTLTTQEAFLPAVSGATLTKVAGTNSVYMQIEYDQTVPEKASWQTYVPDNYDGGNVTAYVHWTSTAVVNDVWFAIQTATVGNSDAIDATLANTQLTASTADGNAGDLSIASGTLTTPWTAGELVRIDLTRDINDSLAADADVHLLVLKFSVAN